MTKWYTLTARVGADEPLQAEARAAETPDPVLLLAAAIRDALGIKGTAYVSDIYLIPEDENRAR